MSDTSDDDDEEGKVVSLDAFRAARALGEDELTRILGGVTHFNCIKKPEDRIGTSENDVLFILDGEGLAFSVEDARGLGLALIEAAAFIRLQQQGVIPTPD